MSFDIEPDAPLHGECELEIRRLTAECEHLRASLQGIADYAARGPVAAAQLIEKARSALSLASSDSPKKLTGGRLVFDKSGHVVDVVLAKVKP